jgi:hypothetical protein
MRPRRWLKRSMMHGTRSTRPRRGREGPDDPPQERWVPYRCALVPEESLKESSPSAPPVTHSGGPQLGKSAGPQRGNPALRPRRPNRGRFQWLEQCPPLTSRSMMNLQAIRQSGRYWQHADAASRARRRRRESARRACGPVRETRPVSAAFVGAPIRGRP